MRVNVEEYVQLAKESGPYRSLVSFVADGLKYLWAGLLVSRRLVKEIVSLMIELLSLI